MLKIKIIKNRKNFIFLIIYIINFLIDIKYFENIIIILLLCIAWYYYFYISLHCHVTCII
jgi:hypothetical protein